MKSLSWKKYLSPFGKEYYESLLKGRITEDIISSMFDESGYVVYPFERFFTGLKEGLNQRGVKNETAKRIASTPDLLIVDKENFSPYLLEVKFRSFESYNISSLLEEFEWYTTYWPDSFLVYVTQNYSIFYCQRVSEIEKFSLDNFQRLDKVFPKIKLETLMKYTKYIDGSASFYGKGGSASHKPENFIFFIYKFLEEELSIRVLHSKRVHYAFLTG